MFFYTSDANPRKAKVPCVYTAIYFMILSFCIHYGQKNVPV